MMYGEIWWVDFGIPFGSETGFKRPSIIVQNDSFNQTAMNTTIVIPLTTNLRLADFPGNTLLSMAGKQGFKKTLLQLHLKFLQSTNLAS